MIRDQEILDYIAAHGPSLAVDICMAHGHAVAYSMKAFRGLQHSGKIEKRREGHNGGNSKNYWAIPGTPKRVPKFGCARRQGGFDDVYALIRAFGPISYHDVMAGLGITENQAHNRLRDLARSGKIDCMRGPARRAIWWAV